jgi:hypothetical protein
MTVMKLKSSLAIAGIVALLGAGAAMAQTTPAPAPAPAKPMAAPAAGGKQALAKECSSQADAKGLHGKERRKFRAECKRSGGKPM